MISRPKVIFHGPLPPPHHGMAMLTEQILASSVSDEFDLIHIDTSDHRGTSNIGSFDAMNVLLALKHGFEFLLKLVLRRPNLVYIQIARTRFGLLRDVQFLLAARATRRRTLIHFQSRGFWDFFTSEPRLFQLIVRAAIPPGTRLVVLGNHLRQDFGNLIDPGNIDVIQNGAIDLGPGQPAGSREPIVVFMATLMAEKGVLDLLQAAVQVCRALPSVQFVVAGTWHREDEAEQARQFIKSNGLTTHVNFVGSVSGEDKVKLLRSAAVLAHPSRFELESQPLVVLDAMSAATPAVLTRIGTTPELMDDGVEGFLVQQGDSHELADRLIVLLNDPALRSRMGAAARRRYERDFTLESFAERLGCAWRCAIASTGQTTDSVD